MKKTGYSIIGLGVVTAIGSLILDLFGIGQRGIQAAQLLGAQAGVIIALLGIGISNTTFNKEKPIGQKIERLFKQLIGLPVIVWVLFGFFAVCIFFYIFPMFFNSDSRMFYFTRYVPDQYPIGGDLLYNTSAIREWLLGNNPYSIKGHFYPPFYHVVFAPILLLGYPNGYYLITSITISAFILIAFLPNFLKNGKNLSIIVFFLLTGLFSYGLQFELERGQFNVIAMTLCLLAIYLFHYHPRFRHLGYFIFSISIHLKLYPAIFIVMFIKDWKDWKNNLKRLIGLGLFNIALLFVAGPDVFSNFLDALKKNSGVAGWTFPGNHSIKAFVYNLTNAGYGQLSSATLPWLKNNATAIELTLMAFFAICFGIVLFNTYRKNTGRLDGDLLLVCTLGAMMLPAVSIDYKLELLAAPMAIALYNRTQPEKTWQKIILAIAIFLASLAYSLTLVPYKYRIPYGVLINGFPMLTVILIAITVMNMLDKKQSSITSQPLTETA